MYLVSPLEIAPRNDERLRHVARSSSFFLRPGESDEESANTRPMAMAKGMEASNANMLTMGHMQQGIDEEGRRIKILTSALTSERAIKAGIGKFVYNGGIQETTRDQNRMHQNNLKATDARHGYGECYYDSGSKYVGQWQNDRRCPRRWTREGRR